MTVSHGPLARHAVITSLSLLLLVLSRHGTVTAAAALQDPADEDLMKASPLTVAQCRAGCLHKVSFPRKRLYFLLRAKGIFFPVTAQRKDNQLVGRGAEASSLGRLARAFEL